MTSAEPPVRLLLDGNETEWDAASIRIRDRLRLVDPKGRPVAEFLLHIEGQEAWWRYSDEPLEDSPPEWARRNRTMTSS